MNKPKLLWIDHSYHKKTASSKFFLNYLKESFIVDEIYDESWDKKSKKQIILPELDQYSAIFLWQSLPNNRILKQLQNRNVIFVPMYDGVQNWDFFKWNKVKDFKILCFSKAIYNLLNKYNFNTLYIQYFTQSKEFELGIKHSIFLWQRVSNINFDLVKKILGDYIEKVHIHKSIDPTHKLTEISPLDIKRYNVTTSTWFDNQEDFENVIKNSEIFIAPRYTEGIGLPFLEAMAMGKVVIANDAPTMNEYIQNGINGFLVDFSNPQPIDLANIDEIKQNAYNSSIVGYNKYLEDRKQVIQFIKNKNKKKSKILGFFLSSLLENLFSYTQKNGAKFIKFLFIKFKI